MGHSTGSQDALHYLSTSAEPAVHGAILVSPASDRQFFEKDNDPVWKEQLVIAQRLIAEGKGEEMLGEEMTKAAGARMTANRVFNLIGVGYVALTPLQHTDGTAASTTTFHPTCQTRLTDRRTYTLCRHRLAPSRSQHWHSGPRTTTATCCPTTACCCGAGRRRQAAGSSGGFSTAQHTRWKRRMLRRCSATRWWGGCQASSSSREW